MNSGSIMADGKSGLSSNKSSKGSASSTSIYVANDRPSILSEYRGVYDAIVNMLGCIDVTLASTEAAAKVLSVELPKYMKITGKFTPLVGVYNNFEQMQVKGFNWNDMGQAGTGVALAGIGLLGGSVATPVVFIGGLGLFVWELAEAYKDLPK